MPVSEITLVFHGAPVKVWQYNAKSQPTIIMLHGLRGTHEGLQLIADQLACRVVVPDMPAFGRSAAVRDQTPDLPLYLDFTDYLIDSLNLTRPPILLGHSLGSVIAAHYAVSHPDKLDRLILVNPIVTPPPLYQRLFASGYYRLGKWLPEPAGRAWLSNRLVVDLTSLAMITTHDRNTRAFVYDQHRTYFKLFADPRSAAELYQMSVHHTVGEVAERITLPTLVIAGELDTIAPLKQVQQTASQLPNAELKIIPAVGHLIHYETPQAAARLITDFYTRG